MAVVVTEDITTYSHARALPQHVARAVPSPAPVSLLARARPEAEPQRVRTFWSPSGRHWTAEIYELPPGVGVRTSREIIAAKAVVRFTSGDLTLDLYNFPADWASRSDDELVDLLRSANPPAFAPLAIDARNQM